MTSNNATCRQSISLNETWTFALDPQDVGLDEGWHQRDLAGAITATQSWAEAGYGSAPTSHYLAGWNPVLEYEGAAWYTRILDVPPAWNGQHVELALKGVRWRSRVWLDNWVVGEDESLSTPHRYDLTPYLKPGSSQRLAIQVNNRMLYPLHESHINSDQTATHWGGITGGAELIVSPQTAVQSVECRPNIAERTFQFEARLRNADGLTLQVTVANPETGKSVENQAVVQTGRASILIQLDADARLWWDDDPFLYDATFTLKQGEPVVDVLRKRVGLREVSTQGQQILLNGKPIFLRGYVDCCIFPLTGYPSWNIEDYRRQFRIARSYGFNHVRLHSWTAPEPFWDAADEFGMLAQTELPHWTAFYTHAQVEPPDATHRFLMSELERIVAALNLHPSWILFSNGNELIGAEGHPRLLELSARGKELDPTRLFTDNTGFGQLPTSNRTVDYFIQSCNWHPPKKIYDAASDDTSEDFSAITALSDRPIIGHEHGQFTMYVRPSEAEKYTGVMRPSWLESVEATFEAKGMTGRVDDYIYASGIHIVRTYKENIERARRTRGLAGIQLLDIRDFPGQGHATTGILDMFWDSKGLIEPESFAEFNGAVTLLMRTPSPTFWDHEPIIVDIEVSNFGREAITDGSLSWELCDSSTATYLSGQINIPAAPVGEVTPLGRLHIPTPSDGRAHAWELYVQLGAVTNSWHLWSFPYPQQESRTTVSTRIAALKNVLPEADFRDSFGGTTLRIDNAQTWLNADVGLAISDRLSQRVLQYLHDGGCVWFMPDAEQLFDRVRTRYLPPFWSHLHFPDNVSSVMGMVVHEHPALAQFPHDGLSDWQWYKLVNDTPAICLDSVLFVEPIVEVIDNFNRAKRLCYAFEAQVGKGRLLVSTWRLYDPTVAGRPEARFLMNEIIRYMQSATFAPKQSLSVGQLLGLFKLTNVRTYNLE